MNSRMLGHTICRTGDAMTDTIEYGHLMHRALRGLIQEVLQDVAENGLPGEHHFFITFDTLHPDVRIADWLSDRYPEEMTIVMQNWFEDLDVTDEGFSITLNFGDNPERLHVPYDAILTFVDPSVEFGLRFETQDDDDDHDEASATPDGAAPADADARDLVEQLHEAKDADVVSLDSFRKT